MFKINKSKIFGVAAILLFSLILIPGCGPEDDYALTNIVLSDKKDNTSGLITEPKTKFANNINYIYGQAELTNPFPDKQTYIQIIWKYTGDNSNSIINTNTINTNLSGTIGFKAQRPGFNWNRGTHMIEFVIDDRIIATHYFEIGDVPIENAYIKSIETASSIDSYHNPTNPTSNFSPTGNTIYLTIATTNQMPINTEVKIEWYYTQKQEFLSSATTTIGPEDQDSFALDKQHHPKFLLSNGNWPSGGYKARIYFDNKYIDEIRFNVS